MRAASRGWRSARWAPLGNQPVQRSDLRFATLPPVDAGPTHGARLTLRDVFPTFGVFALLVFCYVIISHKLPIGSIAAISALLAPFFTGRGLRVPLFCVMYLGYVACAAVGLFISPYPAFVQLEFTELLKVAAIGIAACSVLTTRREIRGFVFGYLAIYALYPVRGALYNFIFGIMPAGRVGWNFQFENPNDLAILTLLPLGMCGYFLFSERDGLWKRAAQLGLVILTLVLLLTQSRGALVGLGAALVYYFVNVQHRGRAVLYATLVIGTAAVFAPSGVWTRLGGLSKASVAAGMAGVDQDNSAQSRWAIAGIAAGIVRDYPATGVGIGGYPSEHWRRTRRDPEVIRSAAGARDTHNTYLRTAAETGIPGLLFILSFLFISFREVARTRKMVPDHLASQRNALLALEVSLLAFSAACFFGSLERLTFFMLNAIVPWVVARSIRDELVSSGTTRRA